MSTGRYWSIFYFLVYSTFIIRCCFAFLFLLLLLTGRKEGREEGKEEGKVGLESGRLIAWVRSVKTRMNRSIAAAAAAACICTSRACYSHKCLPPSATVYCAVCCTCDVSIKNIKEGRRWNGMKRTFFFLYTGTRKRRISVSAKAIRAWASAGAAYAVISTCRSSLRCL